MSEQETLQELGLKWQTDKATVHSYLPIYDRILGACRDSEVHLLEIGAGASTGMWLEYFLAGKVWAVDREIHPLLWEMEKECSRLKCLEGRQEDECFLHRFRDLRFDLIIDDGSHESWHQLLTCHALWQTLKPGGLYCVEDVPGEDRLPYWSMMPGFVAWRILKDGRHDDILVVLKKEELVNGTMEKTQTRDDA